jgi:hypothetical protein
MRFLLLSLLAACPPPPRYVAAQVVSARAPVEDALVAAECGPWHSAARLTDDQGFTRLRLHGDVDISRCIVTVAKPGYRTVEASANACTTATGCPPFIVWLQEVLR